MKFLILSLVILFAFIEKGTMINCNMLQSNKKKHEQEEEESNEDVEDVDGSECYNYGRRGRRGRR
jgi:hypothetical protein